MPSLSPTDLVGVFTDTGLSVLADLYQPDALAHAVFDYYARLAPGAGPCPWVHPFGPAPGTTWCATWVSVDGCRETLGELRDLARAIDSRDFAIRSAAHRHRRKAEDLSALVGAADAVVAHDTPWWSALRAQKETERLPSWSRG